jgi:hypothetical protein
MKYRFVPYTTVDGIPTFKDSDILGLYRRVYEEGLGDQLFYDGSIKDEQQFLQLMKSPGAILHVVLAPDDHPVAMWWLNRLERTHATCHFTLFVELFGTKDRVPIGKEAMRICFDHLGYEVIMGMTPSDNKFALGYARKVGFKEVGEVPHYLWSKEGHSITCTMQYITRKDLRDESSPSDDEQLDG